MTLYSLVPHPDFPPLIVTAVEVELTLDTGEMSLIYRVHGAAELVVPPLAAPERTDGLWRTTCFELFLRPAGKAGYIELNFAPSSKWAAYAFDRYRSGMRDLDTAAPRITWLAAELSATVRHLGFVTGSTCPPAPTSVAPSAPWTPEQVRGDDRARVMALAAVIEEADERKSYWALAHGNGPPDFHNPDCFIATLPAPRIP